MAILKEWKKFTLHKGALYHPHTLARELEEAIWFVVPMAHIVVAMNGCHRDTGYQGQWWTLSLLQCQFWWPGMAMQMQKAISGCKRCIWHEGAQVKAPTTSYSGHLSFGAASCGFHWHWDDNRTIPSPTHSECFGICGHFTRHVMAYMTPDQMAKSAAKFLWQAYISIFRALAKLLSDWGANFESNIISELIGIQKASTSPFHSQTNGQVEQVYQTLMWMIGKLSKELKVDWPKHLPELVHAYNSIRSAVTGYSTHYLMFGKWMHLTIDFYFPTIISTEKHQHVDHYVADLCEWLHEAFNEAQVHSSAEAEMQRWYYDHKANAISLELGNLVLANANAYKGSRNVKDWWEDEPYEDECRIAEGILSYLLKKQQTRCSSVLHQNWLFPITPIMGTLLCSGVWAEWTRCTTTIGEKPTQKVSKNEEVPQSAKCLPPSQDQTGKTPLG